MSSEVRTHTPPAAEDTRAKAVEVRNLAKTFHIYRRPHHRLFQWLADRRGSGRDFAMTVKAVQDASFDVHRGETVVILGRNGSGKSTLLQMVAGTLTPSWGEVVLHGRVSALLELGAGFNPDYTGRENLKLNARIFGLSADEIREAEPAIEAFADIGPFIDEPVRTYSSGMYVRLAFAVAIHVVPDVLIVDEALAVGDVFFQQKCIDYIVNRMHDAAKLIVTHDVSTAARLGDRVLVMDKGELLFDGPPLSGIEFFTSLNLRDRAMSPATVLGRSRKGGTGTPAAAAAEVEPAPVAVAAGTRTAAEAVVTLTEDRSSNPESLRFLNVATGVGDGAARRWQERPAVTAGDTVVLATEFDLKVDLDHPIVGYLVRDRVGNVVFGQNTIGSAVTLAPLRPGRHRASLELKWPELADGEYTITLGVGEGQHPLHHFIVCWAQNIAAVVNSPPRPVHGMFNSDIKSIAIEPA